MSSSSKRMIEEVVEPTKRQYLLFILDETLYAIGSLRAQEIVEYSQVTKVPMMSPCVKGVTNIRGNIVPVIDLLQRFNLGTTTIGSKTSIIVINHLSQGQEIQMGVIIDEVYEVDDISSIDLKDTPEFGSKVDKKFVQNMGRYNKDYIAILDMEAILDLDELSVTVD